MKRPNFFILGAPKCGTTSLADWLGGHPNVFMTTPKEPFYFCTDIVPARKRRLADYEKLFHDVQDGHVIIGEASTDYLYSKRAVPNILSYADDPKFVVMVRNPVEMAYSLYGQKLYQGDEHILSFEEAWRLQERRRSGEAVRRLCRDPQMLLYGPYCQVGLQLQRLYRQVPKQRVLVLVLDDIKEDPRREYQRVLGFLGLHDDGRRDFPVRNVAKTRRIWAVTHFLRAVGSLRRKIGSIYGGFGVLNWINQLNAAERRRPPLSREMKDTLVEYYAEDVARLSQLLDRDLSHWLDV